MIWVAMLQAVEKLWGFLDHGPADDRSVLEHVLQVDQIAVVHVLRIVIGIMEVDDPRLVRLDDILRQEHPLGQVTADLPRHVVPLDTVDRRVLVGVLLLHILVVALDQRQDPVVRRVRAAHEGAFVAVSHVTVSPGRMPLSP